MNEAAAFAHIEGLIDNGEDPEQAIIDVDSMRRESRLASALAVIAAGRLGRQDFNHLLAAANIDILASVPFVLGINRMTVIVQSCVYSLQFLPFYGEKEWVDFFYHDYCVWCVAQLFWVYHYKDGYSERVAYRHHFPRFVGRQRTYGEIFATIKDKKPGQLILDPDTSAPKFPCHFSPPNRGNKWINTLPVKDNVSITSLPYRLFFDLCRDLKHIIEVLHTDLWKKLFEGRFECLDHGTFFGGLLLMARSESDAELVVEVHAKKAWTYIIKVLRHVAFNVENVFDNCGCLVPYLVSFALHWIPGGLITLDHYNSLHNDSNTGLVETASLESDANCKWMVRAIVHWLDEPLPRKIPGQVVTFGLHPMVPAPRNRQTPVVRPVNPIIDDFNDDVDFEAVFDDEYRLDRVKFETDQQYLYFDEEGWLIFPQLEQYQAQIE